MKNSRLESNCSWMTYVITPECVRVKSWSSTSKLPLDLSFTFQLILAYVQINWKGQNESADTDVHLRVGTETEVIWPTCIHSHWLRMSQYEWQLKGRSAAEIRTELLTKWQAITNTWRVLSELLPVVSEELGSGHHMKDEEGGGKEQYLVHRLPLSHVPSLGLLDSSPCQSEGRGEEDEEGVTGGRVWIESKVSSRWISMCFLQGGPLQLPIRRGHGERMC